MEKCQKLDFRWEPTFENKDLLLTHDWFTENGLMLICLDCHEHMTMPSFLGWWGGTAEDWNQIQRKRYERNTKEVIEWYKNRLSFWQKVGYFLLVAKYKFIKMFRKYKWNTKDTK